MATNPPLTPLPLMPLLRGFGDWACCFYKDVTPAELTEVQSSQSSELQRQCPLTAPKRKRGSRRSRVFTQVIQLFR